MHAQTDRPIPRIAVVQATDAVHADALNAVSREILQANTFTHLSQTHSSEKPTEDSGTSNDCLFGVCVCVCVRARARVCVCVGGGIGAGQCTYHCIEAVNKQVHARGVPDVIFRAVLNTGAYAQDVVVMRWR